MPPTHSHSSKPQAESPFPPQDGPCVFNRTHNLIGCKNYGTGHTMHWIKAKLAMQRGWIWRDGIVTEVDGQLGRVAYLNEPEQPRIWYHLPLDEFIRVGDPVRLAESLGGVLMIGARMISIAITDGAGEIPEPTDPEELARWQRRAAPVITNLATGEATSLGAGEYLRDVQPKGDTQE